MSIQPTTLEALPSALPEEDGNVRTVDGTRHAMDIVRIFGDVVTAIVRVEQNSRTDELTIEALGLGPDYNRFSLQGHVVPDFDRLFDEQGDVHIKIAPWEETVEVLGVAAQPIMLSEPSDYLMNVGNIVSQYLQDGELASSDSMGLHMMGINYKSDAIYSERYR